MKKRVVAPAAVSDGAHVYRASRMALACAILLTTLSPLSPAYAQSADEYRAWLEWCASVGGTSNGDASNPICTSRGPLSPATTQPPQLDGAIFQRQIILPPDSTLVASTRFEIRGTRGVYTGWALGQGTERKRCRLEGFVCAFDAHFLIEIAADGQSATEIVRRSDGRVLEGSQVLPRVW